MKRIKFISAFGLVVITTVVISSFISNERDAKTLFTHKFKYIGPIGGTPTLPSYGVADVEKPSNWLNVDSTPPDCNNIPIFVCTLYTINSQVYVGGSKNGLPKVDVMGTIQTDVLLGTQAGTFNHVQAVPDNGTDKITVNVSRP